ncbi:MAG: hemolysin III family protein [Weeksellaceae bacterium]|jgi:hemolysin III|nr:hemolysin III family protein [Weeksellaceae bacterium]
MTFKNISLRNEEFWNTITHGIGALLSIPALVLMIYYSSVGGSLTAILSSIAFGLGLIFLYTASTFYHAAKNPRKKLKLRLFDHLCIYLLIAGTYTPVMLVGLKGVMGWTMFGIVWGMVVLGFVFKLSPLRKNKKLSLILYAAMGWMAIVAIKPLIEQLSVAALIYLALGGLAYTVGIYFYANNKIKFNHLIWHLFVMAGSISHFIGVFFYIL